MQENNAEYTPYGAEKERHDIFYNFPIAFWSQTNTQLRIIKAKLGKRCSYISWTRHNDDYGIKAVLDGKQVDVAMGGMPYHVDSEGYTSLYEKLRDHGKDK